LKGIEQKGLDGAGLRIAVVAARWNAFVSEKLEAGAIESLRSAGLPDEDIETVHVPGAFELPLGALTAAESGRFDAVVCLGTVIRGDTPHFDFIAGEAARGIMDVGLRTRIPVTFGVITADNDSQATDRAGGAAGNKGAEAADAAVEMALLRRKLAGVDKRRSDAFAAREP